MDIWKHISKTLKVPQQPRYQHQVCVCEMDRFHRKLIENIDIMISTRFTKEFLYLDLFISYSRCVNYFTYVSIKIDTPSKSPSKNVQYFKGNRPQPDK